MAKPGVVRKYTRREVETHEDVFIDHDQVKFELFRRFGVLAAAGDRRLAEFVPWFLTSRDSCYRWGFMLTPYSYRLKRYQEAPKQFRQMMRRGEFPSLLTSGEEYLDQMIAITGKGMLKTNVNLPNRGQVEGIPERAIVETNAVFSKDRVEPVASGRLPANVNVMVLRHGLNQESLVKAVSTRDDFGFLLHCMVLLFYYSIQFIQLRLLMLGSTTKEEIECPPYRCSTAS